MSAKRFLRDRKSAGFPPQRTQRAQRLLNDWLNGISCIPLSSLRALRFPFWRFWYFSVPSALSAVNLFFVFLASFAVENLSPADLLRPISPALQAPLRNHTRRA